MTKFLRRSFAAATFALGTLAGGAAFAQTTQDGLVNVNIEDPLLENILNDLDINISDIAIVVQAPIGVAANVCDVNANVLAEQERGGGAECDAQSTSTALNGIVQRTLANQGQGGN